MTNTAYEQAPHLSQDGSHRSAERVLPLIFDLVAPANVVDVGCGSGAWLEVAQHLGATRVLGIDDESTMLESLRIAPELFEHRELARIGRFDERFDLAMCLEIAESLDPGDAWQLVESLCALSDVVLFSAAIPGQTGIDHRNEQWPPYWEAMFAANDFHMVDCLRIRLWDDPTIEPAYAQNSLLYVSRDRLAADAKLREARMENGLMPLCAVHPGMFNQLVRPTVPAQPDPRPSLPAPRQFEGIHEV
ncbi:MAG: class I SAM-dependent methyltransferase [Sporichthyaceae bacterium]